MGGFQRNNNGFDHQRRCQHYWTIEYEKMMSKIIERNASFEHNIQNNTYTISYLCWNRLYGESLIDYCKKNEINHPYLWTFEEQKIRRKTKTYFYD